MQSKKQIFVGAVTDIHTVDKEGVGIYRWERDANGWKGFMYVRNTSLAALAIGNVVYHGTTGFAITTGANPTTFLEEVFSNGQAGKNTQLAFMAGVAVSAIPIGGFGWIQVFGYNALIQVESTVSIASGETLKGVSGQLYAVHDSAVGVAAIARRHITALTVSAGAGVTSTAHFINCF